MRMGMAVPAPERCLLSDLIPSNSFLRSSASVTPMSSKYESVSRCRTSIDIECIANSGAYYEQKTVNANACYISNSNTVIYYEVYPKESK